MHRVSPQKLRIPFYKCSQFNLSLWCWPYSYICPLPKVHLQCMLWGAERHEMWDVRRAFTADTSRMALGQQSLAYNEHRASPQDGKTGGAWRWQLHLHLAPRSTLSRPMSISPLCTFVTNTRQLRIFYSASTFISCCFICQFRSEVSVVVLF